MKKASQQPHEEARKSNRIIDDNVTGARSFVLVHSHTYELARPEREGVGFQKRQSRPTRQKVAALKFRPEDPPRMFDPWTWTLTAWTLTAVATVTTVAASVLETVTLALYPILDRGASNVTDTNTPAPTLEETETNLANLDPKTANILRRRMGLAIVETEPSREREEERERRAESRKQLEAMFPTPRVIDRTSLELLDAEIAENARRRAEEEANKVVEFNERAHRESEAVTAALEPIKARARKVSHVLRRREEAIVRIRAELPDRFLFQHSVFCQTVLGCV